MDDAPAEVVDARLPQARAVVHELLVQGGSSRKPRQCWRSIQPPDDAHKTEELAF